MFAIDGLPMNRSLVDHTWTRRRSLPDVHIEESRSPPRLSTRPFWTIFSPPAVLAANVLMSPSGLSGVGVLYCFGKQHHKTRWPCGVPGRSHPKLLVCNMFVALCWKRGNSGHCTCVATSSSPPSEAGLAYLEPDPSFPSDQPFDSQSRYQDCVLLLVLQLASSVLCMSGNWVTEAGRAQG